MRLIFERQEHLHKHLSLYFKKYKQMSKCVGLLLQNGVNNFSMRDLRDRVHRSDVVVIEGNISNVKNNTK